MPIPGDALCELFSLTGQSSAKSLYDAHRCNLQDDHESCHAQHGRTYFLPNTSPHLHSECVLIDIREKENNYHFIERSNECEKRAGNHTRDDERKCDREKSLPWRRSEAVSSTTVVAIDTRKRGGNNDDHE